MHNYYLFETMSRNKYCYNVATAGLLLCHPLLYHMILLHRGGQSVSSWYEGLGGTSTVAISNGEIWGKEDVDYYYRKFFALLKQGMFSGQERSVAIGGRLSARDVETALQTTGTVTFELTEACNLHCSYCCYGEQYKASEERSGRYMTEDMALTFLDHLFAIWNSAGGAQPRKISIGFYGGEPLLAFPVLERIVERSKTLNGSRRPLEFRMTSNGLLTEKYAEFLSLHDVALLISLDGDEKSNSYRVFRNGTPAFTDVLQSVGALQTRYPSYFDRRVRFHAVFNDRSSVDRIYEFFKITYTKMPKISRLSTVGLKATCEKTFQAMYGDPVESLERSIMRMQIEQEMFPRLAPASYVTQFICRNCFLQIRDLDDLLGGPVAQSLLPTGTCIPFSRRVFLAVDGAILPCERIGRASVLGRVSSTGVEIDYEGIARQYNVYYDQIRNVCGDCHHYSSCSVCMFELDLGRSDVRCPGFVSDLEFSRYLADMFGYLEENPWVIPRTVREVELT